jgi:uncharacterized protein (TIGR02594 family)
MAKNNPAVLAMLQLDASWPQTDEVEWCSAFCNYICWLARAPRSKSLAARSWLGVGEVVSIDNLNNLGRGLYVVVLKRGGVNQPGPEVVYEDGTYPPGHVGFFAGVDANNVYLLGGNQGNAVNVQAFPRSRILGVRFLGDH